MNLNEYLHRSHINIPFDLFSTLNLAKNPTFGQLFDPPLLPSLLSLLNRPLINPLPADTPPAAVSQHSPSISRAARQRISPEANGNKTYSVTASAGERKTYCYEI